MRARAQTQRLTEIVIRGWSPSDRVFICCSIATATAIATVRPPRPVGAATPFAPVTTANDLWTVDFKEEFRTCDRCYCYPLTLRDAGSRYVLRCDVLREDPGETQRRSRQRLHHLWLS